MSESDIPEEMVKAFAKALLECGGWRDYDAIARHVLIAVGVPALFARVKERERRIASLKSLMDGLMSSLHQAMTERDRLETHGRELEMAMSGPRNPNGGIAGGLRQEIRQQAAVQEIAALEARVRALEDTLSEQKGTY